MIGIQRFSIHFFVVVANFSSSNRFTKDAWKRVFNMCQYKWLRTRLAHHNHQKNQIQRNKMGECANDHEIAPTHFQLYSINVNTEHKPTAEM